MKAASPARPKTTVGGKPTKRAPTIGGTPQKQSAKVDQEPIRTPPEERLKRIEMEIKQRSALQDLLAR